MKHIQWRGKVHYYSTTPYCNHITLDDDEFIYTDSPVNCEHCITMDSVYEGLSKQIQTEIDKEIIESLNKKMENG